MSGAAEVAAQIINNQLEDKESPVGACVLPCGYLDDEGAIYTEAVVREITGEEEDMLSSRSVPNDSKMNELISRCVTSIGPFTERPKLRKIVKELTVGDRIFLIFAIRRVTLGDVYPFQAGCTSCGDVSLYQVNLSKLEVKEMEDPKVRVFDDVLPSGKKVRFHAMTGEGEEKLAKVAKKRKNDHLSLSILMRVDMLDGSPPSLQDLKRLGMRDRNYLRDQFDKREGGVDTTMELQCPGCGNEFKTELAVDARNFFFPSQTSSD